MTETLQWLDPSSLAFPPLNSALSEPNGLLALGGDLSTERLVSAYSHGIFPWYNQGEPVLWWSPDPRAIIPTTALRINRSLRKFLKQCPYRVTINHAFEEVITYCADAPFRKEGTWILDEMQQAYTQLHQQGMAHSVEVWDNSNNLVGGLYGVAIGGFFSGESMFYLQSNASKVALVALAQLLNSQAITFIDCQIVNPFLADMGCIELSRNEFIKLQSIEKQKTMPNDFWLPRQLSLAIL